MAAPRPVYVCATTTCDWSGAKWQGRCPKCQEWGTIPDVGVLLGTAGGAGSARATGLKGNLSAGAVTEPARHVRDISALDARHIKTGIGELDRVLGGGIVRGGVILLAGEPGVGKSTLLGTVASRFAERPAESVASGPVLYVTGEESVAQVKARCERIGALGGDGDFLIAAETDLGAVIAHIEQVQPSLLILDSVQTVASADVAGSAGGMSQVMEVASSLSRIAKARGMSLILVGQATKSGDIAGPRALEHLVDASLYLEGDPRSTLRMLRATKNRYGTADEVGCFENRENGIVEIEDPSSLFLGSREVQVPGTCVTVAMEGKRPLLVEIQALVGYTGAQNPRRTVSGVEQARVLMALAVTERHGRMRFGDRDVLVSTVGGVRLNEPAADLAVCLAIAGSNNSMVLPYGALAIGEVSLSGELRSVPGLGRRLAEAHRMGFTHAVVPAKADLTGIPKAMVLKKASFLYEAFENLRPAPDEESGTRAA